MPDMDFAQKVIESYAEDGVGGELAYDPESQQWAVILNDAEYQEYQEKVKKNHASVLELIRMLKQRWHGVNIQSGTIEPPLKNMKRLVLYLMDVDCETGKTFKVTNSFKDILDRKTKTMVWGSTCSMCGRRVAVVLDWEDASPTKKVP